MPKMVTEHWSWLSYLRAVLVFTYGYDICLIRWKGIFTLTCHMPLMISLYPSFPVSSSLLAPCRPALLHSWSRCSGGVRSLSSLRLNMRPHCRQMPGVWIDSFCAIPITRAESATEAHGYMLPLTWSLIQNCAWECFSSQELLCDWHVLNVSFWLLMAIYTTSIQYDTFVMFIVLMFSQKINSDMWQLVLKSDCLDNRNWWIWTIRLYDCHRSCRYMLFWTVRM